MGALHNGHSCSCAAVWSRRGFLGSALAAAVPAFSATTSLPGAAQAQTTMTPDAALSELAEGNRRFTEQRMTSFNEDLKLLKEKTAGGQAPFAALLSCADSRVPVELIFDQSIGRLFVTRVAGNVTTPEMLASLEYGVAVLGVKAIVVLGHAECGAVKAAIDGKPVPGQISVLYTPLRPAVEQAGQNLEAAIKANAKIQAGLVGLASPILAAQVKAGQLKVVAAYYDLASGAVTMM